MKSRTTILIFLLIALVALPISVSARRLSSAKQQFNSAATVFRSTVRDAQEVLLLRAQKQQVASTEQPQQDVIARVNVTLAAVGLPDSCFRSLAPQGSASVSSQDSTNNPNLSQQSMRLNLSGLTPEELGRFLIHWQEHQPLWTVSQLDLTHPPHTPTQNTSRSRQVRGTNQTMSQNKGIRVGGRGNVGGGGSDGGERYEVSLVLSAIYVSQ